MLQCYCPAVNYWTGPALSLFGIGALLFVAAGLRRLPGLSSLGVPASLLAGVLGLAIAPGGLDLVPFDIDTLESVVYHGLGVLFIALGLQRPRSSSQGASSRALAFGIVTLLALQTALGLGMVLLLGLVTEPMHPGYGLMLVLGFEQGPGQALALGSVWEEGGMTDGAQVGLIVAAIGYAWAIFIGVPLAAIGKARGWVSPPPPPEAQEAVQTGRADDLGALDLLSLQIAVIGLLYVLTWAICTGISEAILLTGDEGLARTIWGFHFLVGAGLAMVARSVHQRLGLDWLDDPQLGHVGGLVVDFITAAALTAVQLTVLSNNWLPILLVTSIGGVVTLGVILWVAPRAFPDAPFEHCVLWFGMATGTLPTGLALLRMVDPDLRSPAPVSAVAGSAMAIPGGAPILLGILPASVAAWPGTGVWTWLGITVVYGLVVFGAWRFFGGLGAARGPRFLV